MAGRPAPTSTIATWGNVGLLGIVPRPAQVVMAGVRPVRSARLLLTMGNKRQSTRALNQSWPWLLVLRVK